MIFLNRKKITFKNDIITLNKSDSHYISRVRRAKTGDIIQLYSQQSLYTLIIVDIKKKTVTLTISEHHEIVEPQQVAIVLPMADIKALESAVQHSIEAGVSKLFICRTEHSNSKKHIVENKLQRFEQIIESAASQSRRYCHPSISIVSFAELINQAESSKNIIFHPSGVPISPDIINKNFSDKISLWIGPEAGFSQKEIETFRKHNFEIFSLCTPILRMENAVTLAAGYITHTINKKKI